MRVGRALRPACAVRGCLEVEQCSLRFDAADISAQLSVGAHHAMTRHDDGQWIPRAGTADRSGRPRVPGDVIPLKMPDDLRSEES